MITNLILSRDGSKRIRQFEYAANGPARLKIRRMSGAEGFEPGSGA